MRLSAGRLNRQTPRGAFCVHASALPAFRFLSLAATSLSRSCFPETDNRHCCNRAAALLVTLFHTNTLTLVVAPVACASFHSLVTNQQTPLTCTAQLPTARHSLRDLISLPAAPPTVDCVYHQESLPYPTDPVTDYLRDRVQPTFA